MSCALAPSLWALKFNISWSGQKGRLPRAAMGHILFPTPWQVGKQLMLKVSLCWACRIYFAITNSLGYTTQQLWPFQSSLGFMEGTQGPRAGIGWEDYLTTPWGISLLLKLLIKIKDSLTSIFFQVLYSILHAAGTQRCRADKVESNPLLCPPLSFPPWTLSACNIISNKWIHVLSYWQRAPQDMEWGSTE